MHLLYVLALVPVAVGAILWLKFRSVVWWEWLGGCVLALATCGLIHASLLWGLTGDSETWSGQVETVHHSPAWTSAHLREDRSGGKTTVYQRHDPTWWVETTLGRIQITETRFSQLKSRFGGRTRTVPGHRPDHHSGPRNDTQLINSTAWMEPVTDRRWFQNRLKAARTVFGFQKVPADAKVFAYPINADRFQSDRLLGRANAIHLLDWDQMNARLGPRQLVNVIMIGFPRESSPSIAQLQEAAWLGGRKNDLVLCFGGANGSLAGWSYVFGWTEEEMLKRKLETILLSQPIDSGLIPLIEQEIRLHYVIRDWSQFDYVMIDPPWWGYLTLILVMSVGQGLFYVWAHRNDHDDVHVLEADALPYARRPRLSRNKARKRVTTPRQ